MSINADENEMIAIGSNFAKAMGSFVQTDFQYFGYLRNRQRYYIGSKFVGGATSNPLARKSEEKKDSSGGGFRRKKPDKDPINVPVPIYLPEREYENETEEPRVHVPSNPKNKPNDHSWNNIIEFDRITADAPIISSS